MNLKDITPTIYRLAFVGLLAGGFTPWYIVARLPFWPLRPDSAHASPFNNHGTIHYMGKWEGVWANNIMWVFFPSMLLLVGTGIAGKFEDKRGPKP